MHIRCEPSPASKLRVDLCVLPYFGGKSQSSELEQLDQQTKGRLLREVRRRSVDPSKRGSVAIYQSHGDLPAEIVALVGMGEWNGDGASPDLWRRLGGIAMEVARSVRAHTVALSLSGPGSEAATVARLGPAIEGAQLGSYRFHQYKSRAPSVLFPARCHFGGVPRSGAAREAEQRAAAIVEGTVLARDLINHPAEVVTPAHLAAVAQRLARQGKMKIRIFTPRELRREGMGAILSVGRGSANEPRLIELIYTPPGQRSRKGASRVGKGARAEHGKGHVALVGKGITFDSGGLSLKPPGSMEIQKRDMSGGAAVLGAMSAIAKIKPPIEVRGYVAAAENMPGGRAYRPGDVLRTYTGRTVEVLNTDAEGRLVLADALGYATAGPPVRPVRPRWVIDLATLTGAVRTALGTHLAGVMSNNRSLVQRLIEKGRDCGEPMWELPLVEEYVAAMESTVADLKNVGDSTAGTIFGGLFLREFVHGVPWAHLDIAAVAYAERAQAYAPKGAVGWGVRTLVGMVESA